MNNSTRVFLMSFPTGEREACSFSFRMPNPFTDTLVFRDIIARVGDRGRLFQELECRAPMNSLLGCHSMWRSVCEIAYTCGTGDRPVLCRCVEKFGYPEPIQNGTRTFADACAEEEESALALEVS